VGGGGFNYLRGGGAPAPVIYLILSWLVLGAGGGGRLYLFLILRGWGGGGEKKNPRGGAFHSQKTKIYRIFVYPGLSKRGGFFFDPIGGGAGRGENLFKQKKKTQTNPPPPPGPWGVPGWCIRGFYNFDWWTGPGGPFFPDKMV